MINPIEIKVRRLQKSDNRDGFRSGNIELDHFFHRYAGQNQFKHHIGTTYIAEADNRIVGFITVSLAELVAEKIGKAISRHLPIPYQCFELPAWQ